MGRFLKKLPVLTLAGLSVCLIAAACGHSAGQASAAAAEPSAWVKVAQALDQYR